MVMQVCSSTVLHVWKEGLCTGDRWGEAFMHVPNHRDVFRSGDLGVTS